jgi:hypothetical protein
MGLTTDPSRYLPTSQEPNYIRCKVITVEFDQVVRIRMVHVLKREEVFVECILINLGSSAIDDLDGLASLVPGPHEGELLTRYRLSACLLRRVTWTLPFPSRGRRRIAVLSTWCLRGSDGDIRMTRSEM